MMPADVAMHPLTLSFRGRELERAYRTTWNASMLRPTRIGLLLTAGLMALAFLTRNLGLLPPDVTATMRWFEALSMLVSLTALAATWTRFAAAHLHSLLFGCAVWSPVSFVLAYRVLPLGTVEGIEASWAGALVLVVLLLQLGFARSAAVVGAFVAGYHVCVDHSTRSALVHAAMFDVIGATCLVSAYFAERRDRRLFLDEREVQRERERSERLLLNVLPAPIAERLKRGPAVIADGFDAVTVLFADMVGFTPMSARMAPGEVVQLLNGIFTEFDALARRHGLEKIKTIGDAYMVVGGVPEARGDHAPAVAAMALDMRAAVEARGAGLQLRIGMHSGPVVAGVIGTSKFSYDLWGDTVNTASRLESHGAPGAIHVSEATRALLGDAFELEARGEVELKGKGPMRTWWLRRRTQTLRAPAA